jgi:hypothetical protein
MAKKVKLNKSLNRMRITPGQRKRNALSTNLSELRCTQEVLMQAIIGHSSTLSVELKSLMKLILTGTSPNQTHG